MAGINTSFAILYSRIYSSLSSRATISYTEAWIAGMGLFLSDFLFRTPVFFRPPCHRHCLSLISSLTLSAVSRDHMAAVIRNAFEAYRIVYRLALTKIEHYKATQTMCGKAILGSRLFSSTQPQKPLSLRRASVVAGTVRFLPLSSELCKFHSIGAETL